MSKKHLKMEPIQQARATDGVSPNDVWWYEENRGLDVRIDLSRITKKHISFTIPWYCIRRALKRKDTP